MIKKKTLNLINTKEQVFQSETKELNNPTSELVEGKFNLNAFLETIQYSNSQLLNEPRKLNIYKYQCNLLMFDEYRFYFLVSHNKLHVSMENNSSYLMISDKNIEVIADCLVSIFEKSSFPYFSFNFDDNHSIDKFLHAIEYRLGISTKKVDNTLFKFSLSQYSTYSNEQKMLIACIQQYLYNHFGSQQVHVPIFSQKNYDTDFVCMLNKELQQDYEREMKKVYHIVHSIYSETLFTYKFSKIRPQDYYLTFTHLVEHTNSHEHPYLNISREHHFFYGNVKVIINFYSFKDDIHVCVILDGERTERIFKMEDEEKQIEAIINYVKDLYVGERLSFMLDKTGYYKTFQFLPFPYLNQKEGDIFKDALFDYIALYPNPERALENTRPSLKQHPDVGMQVSKSFTLNSEKHHIYCITVFAHTFTVTYFYDCIIDSNNKQKQQMSNLSNCVSYKKEKSILPANVSIDALQKNLKPIMDSYPLINERIKNEMVRDLKIEYFNLKR